MALCWISKWAAMSSSTDLFFFIIFIIKSYKHSEIITIECHLQRKSLSYHVIWEEPGSNIFRWRYWHLTKGLLYLGRLHQPEPMGITSCRCHIFPQGGQKEEREEGQGAGEWKREDRSYKREGAEEETGDITHHHDPEIQAREQVSSGSTDRSHFFFPVLDADMSH